MINYELGLLIAVLSVVYTGLLTDSNMIFNGVYNKLYKFFKTDKRSKEGKPIHPLFMILIHCEKCFAGQFSFWIYILINRNEYFDFPFEYFITHIFFVSYTILVAYIIANIIKHIKHNE